MLIRRRTLRLALHQKSTTLTVGGRTQKGGLSIVLAEGQQPGALQALPAEMRQATSASAGPWWRRMFSSRPGGRSLLLLLLLIPAGQQMAAQSLDRNTPAPLQSGNTTASVDSLIGAHYYYFFAEPGSFTLTFNQGGAEGLGASGKASTQAGFSPATPGAVIKVASTPTSDVYSGSVKVRTRVGVAVRPPNSPLVRSTVSYTLAAAGRVSFTAAGAAGPPIAGMYSTMYNNPLGAVRFSADGTVEASNGQTGTWKLFDQVSATYVVFIAGQRSTLRLDPGRGLIDVQTNLIPFSRAH